jgi:sialic acid synthase SpsE
LLSDEVKFVAEVSSNHHRDLNRCMKFIEAAADLGCRAVKFQLFKIRELFAPEILARSEMHRQREKWELPVSFLPDLAGQCRRAGIQFACTPFYLKAVDELFPFVDFYKIASYELLWENLLTLCGQTGKPVVLSTGMAKMEECERAVEVLQYAGCREVTLLHCVSGYPAPPEDCNLAAIEALRRVCRCPVGWSDHSVNPGVIYRAVHRWQASMVEFHLDLEGQGEEFQTGHCWLPIQIRPVMETIQTGFGVDGTGKKIPSPSELMERDWRADPRDGLRPMMHARKEGRS